MEESENQKGKEIKPHTTVTLRGEDLKNVIALRHKKEEKAGRAVSMTEVVRQAVKDMHKREIEGGV